MKTSHIRERLAQALAISGLVAAALLYAMPLPAAEIVSSLPREIAAETDLDIREGQVNLSLEDAIFISLRRNLGLQVQRYQREQIFHTISQSQGIFDLGLSASLGALEETTPSATALDGSEVRESERQNLDLRLDQLVSTGGTVSFVWNNDRFETNSLFASVNPSFNVGMDFLFTQPLLAGRGKAVTKRNILVASNSSEISAELLEQQIILSVETVEGAYWDLVEAQEQYNVSLESLALAEELHQMNGIQVEVGTLAPLELVQSEVGVAIREEEVLRARVTAEDFADVLRQLLNLHSTVWTTPIEPTTDPLTDRIAIDLDAAISVAMASRSELREQELRIANLEYDVLFFKSQVKPRLDLELRYGYNGLGGDVFVGGSIFPPRPGEKIPGGYGDAIEQIFEARFDGWGTGLQFAMPIQNREAKARRTIAELAVEQGFVSLEDLRLGVLTSVRRTTRAVESAAEAIDLAQKSTDLAEKNLDAERKRYENGISGSFQVLEIQEDLTTARSGEVSAIANYRRVLVLYYRAIGRLLEEKGIELQDDVDVEEQQQ